MIQLSFSLIIQPILPKHKSGKVFPLEGSRAEGRIWHEFEVETILGRFLQKA